MGRWMSLLYIILIIFGTSVFYEFKRWSNETHAKLELLKGMVRDSYKDSTETFKPLRDEVVSAMKWDYLNALKKEIEDVFTPDHKHDLLLKYELKYATRDPIQKDITNTVRTLVKDDIKKITEEVVNEIAADDQNKIYPENLCSKDKKLPANQKLLVYTVFGTRKLYYEGIPEMLKEAVASNLYYDWRIRIYHDALITPEVKAKYKDYRNLDFCDARKLPRYGNITNILGKFWRNVPMADDSVDIVCSRDLDSALTLREEDAVRVFLKSDKLIHTMRDFSEHNAGMLAGMWCMKPVTNRPMARKFLETLLEEAKSYKRRTDQPLLNKVIFDTIVDKQKYILQHDAFFCKHFEGTVPFPTQRRDNMEFVGCPNHVCNWKGFKKCPVECRPKEHQDWEYC